MRIEWLDDDDAFERLEPEWNDLLHQGVSDTLFLTWEFQTAWWKHLGSGRLCLITVREDDGKLLGILPLFWDPSPNGRIGETAGAGATLSLIGCIDVSDYLDVIAARGETGRVYPALVEALVRPDFPAWEHVQLCTLPASSPTNVQLKLQAQACGLKTEWRLHDVSPRIDLPATWDEYLASLDKKQRHEIRRKLRRTEESGARWRMVQSQEELEGAMADFIELHRKSQPGKHLSMDARMKGFFVEMARALQARDWLQLEFLEVEGERAAGILSFVYNNEVLVYNSGYDPVKFGHLSPGITLFAHSIQEAIESGRKAYDFLRGDEEYKYRFGARNENVYELHLWKN